MLVYIALALAVAFVLRRGDGPGVMGGIVLGVTRDLRRTRSRRDSSRTGSSTYDDPDRLRTDCRRRSDTGTRSGCLAAIGARRGARLRGARPPTSIALAAAAAIPIMADDAVLHVLPRRVGRAQAFGFVAVAVAFGPAAAAAALDQRPSSRSRRSLCIAYASRLDALTTRGRAAAAAAQRRAPRGGSRLPSRWSASAALAWAARDGLPARRCLAARSAGRFDVALAVWRRGCAWPALWSRPVARRAAIDGLKDRFDADPPSAPATSTRASSASPATDGAMQLRVAWTQGRERSARRERRGHVRVPLVRAPSRPPRRSRRPLAVPGDVRRARLRRALVARRRCCSCSVAASVRARRRGSSPTATWRATSPGARPARFDWHWEMVGVTHDRAPRGRGRARRRRALVRAASSGVALVRRPSSAGLALSVFAVVESRR